MRVVLDCASLYRSGMGSILGALHTACIERGWESNDIDALAGSIQRIEDDLAR